jgi:ADP-ribose pyrophosphatase YjhB (NUDIX family)
MEPRMEPRWLEWSRELQAIAQTGLTYARDPFDIERYEQVRELAARIFAHKVDLEAEAALTILREETGHATPKVDVRGVVFRDERILLVRERLDGLWTLPGGWADVNESASEATVREVREESGYETRAVKLLAIWDRRKHGHPPSRHHAYKLFFQCDLMGGDPTTSIETTDSGFFSPDALPELSTGRVTPSQIGRLFQHFQNPNLPTDFD